MNECFIKNAQEIPTVVNFNANKKELETACNVSIESLVA